MAERILDAYCPTCREWTVCDVGRPCAWCDTITVRKRGGWRRPDRQRFTRAQLEVFATLHARGATLRDIGRALYQRLGYSSPQSCSECIRESLHREGLYVQPQGAATAARNRAARQRPADEDKNAYKRRMRRERGYRSPRTGEWRIAQEV